MTKTKGRNRSTFLLNTAVRTEKENVGIGVTCSITAVVKGSENSRLWYFFLTTAVVLKRKKGGIEVAFSLSR